MKTVGLLLLFVVAAHSLPRKRSTDDVEIIPMEKQTPGGDVNPGHGDYDGFDPFVARSPPFWSFSLPSFRTWPQSFTNPYLDRWVWGFQDSMRRMREQMDSMWRQIAQNATVIDVKSLPGNTTTETEVVDGNLITRNITTYHRDNDGSTVVIHVQSIDIKPVDATGVAPEQKPPVPAVASEQQPPLIEGSPVTEVVENVSENEISKDEARP